MAPNGVPSSTERHKRQWKCSRCGEWTWLDKDRCHDCNGQRAKVECKAGIAAAQSRKPVRKGLGVGACGGERPQVDTSSGFVPAGRNRTERRAATRTAKQLEKDLSELQERREKDKTADSAASADAAGSQVSEASAEVSAINKKIKLAEKAVKHLNDIEADMREYLYGSTGAFDQALAKATADAEQAHAEKRGKRSLHEQKGSAEAHLKRLQSKVGEAAVKSSELQAQKEDIDKKIAEQLELTAKLQLDVEKAKTDVLALSDRVAEELRGSSAGAALAAGAAAGAAQSQVSTQELAAVQCLLGCLAAAEPTAVLGPGCKSQEELKQHTAHLQNLFARLAGPPPAQDSQQSMPHQAVVEESSEMDQDIDDDQAERLAEVVTESIEDEAAEARAVRVAAAKVRLKGQGQAVVGIVAKRAKLKKSA